MPTDKNAPEVPMAGGKASSSALVKLHKIPTEVLVRLGRRFELGEERKKDKAWNATTSNQEVLADKEFALSRIDHVIMHALTLRDKIVRGAPLLDDDDDAAAIAWGGAYLICSTKEMDCKPKTLAVPHVLDGFRCVKCGSMTWRQDEHSVGIYTCRDCGSIYHLTYNSL